MRNLVSSEIARLQDSFRAVAGTRRGLMAAGTIAGTLALVSGGLVLADTHTTGKSELLQHAATVSTVVEAPKVPYAVAPARPYSFADLVERVSPAVATIQVDIEGRMQPSALEDELPFQFFRRFGQGPSGQGQRNERAYRGQAGSGFVIDADGYVVTNNHVVESARKITVKLADKREFEAKLVGADKDTDVALLKIEAHNLPTVKLGDDSHLRVGDWVVAVGNPFGLGGTVTAGIVSSMGRDIGDGRYTDYIQIDAPINRGNSGGPTFDIGGQVVGMNTAIYSPSGGSVGIGFAVPASTVRTIVEELKSHGSVTRGWLGVSIQDVTPDIASGLGLKDAKGALVANVVSSSPASRAGFAEGDIVQALNDKPISDAKAMTREVAALHAGDHANFTVMRDGKTRTLTATIEKRDADRVASADGPSGPGTPSLGMSLMTLNPALRQQYELDDSVTGVVIASVDPNGEAAAKGLKPGDVVKRAGGRVIRVPSDVTRAVTEAKQAGRESVLLLVANEEGEHFVALKLARS